jgi:hypothetical protein
MVWSNLRKGLLNVEKEEPVVLSRSSETFGFD